MCVPGVAPAFAPSPPGPPSWGAFSHPRLVQTGEATLDVVNLLGFRERRRPVRPVCNHPVELVVCFGQPVLDAVLELNLLVARSAYRNQRIGVASEQCLKSVVAMVDVLCLLPASCTAIAVAMKDAPPYCAPQFAFKVFSITVEPQAFELRHAYARSSWFALFTCFSHEHVERPRSLAQSDPLAGASSACGRGLSRRRRAPWAIASRPQGFTRRGKPSSRTCSRTVSRELATWIWRGPEARSPPMRVSNRGLFAINWTPSCQSESPCQEQNHTVPFWCYLQEQLHATRLASARRVVLLPYRTNLVPYARRGAKNIADFALAFSATRVMLMSCNSR
jgi:hypothetical protein